MRFNVLYNFISPVTGRVLADPDYVLVGNSNGVALPSPILIDVRLDIVQLRQRINNLLNTSFVLNFPNIKLPHAQVLSNLPDGFLFNTEGILSTVATLPSGVISLSEGKLLIGGVGDLAIETQIINLNNMPNLTFKKIWRGNVSNRAVESDDLTNLDIDLQSSKASILSQLGDLAGIVNALSTTVDAVSGTVNAIETGLAGVGGFVAIAAAIAGVVSLGIRMGIAEDDINNLEHSVGILIVQVADIYGQISSINSQISTINSQIITIQGNITTIQGQIITLFNDITLVNTRIDNLRLNTIPADGDVSFYNFKLIDLADADLENPTNGVNVRTLTSVVNATELTLEGDVTGTGVLSSPITTELQLTLDEIKVAEDTVNLNDQKISNLKCDEVEEQDALNFKFFWDFMHNRVEVSWP